MDDKEVRQVVVEVLAEQHRLHNAEVDEVVLKTIATILTSFGIEEEDRVEMRADLIHLRKSRKSFEAIQSLTIGVIITTLVGGFLTAVWLGTKALLNK